MAVDFDPFDSRYNKYCILCRQLSVLQKKKASAEQEKDLYLLAKWCWQIKTTLLGMSRILAAMPL